MPERCGPGARVGPPAAGGEFRPPVLRPRRSDRTGRAEGSGRSGEEGRRGPQGQTVSALECGCPSLEKGGKLARRKLQADEKGAELGVIGAGLVEAHFVDQLLEDDRV